MKKTATAIGVCQFPLTNGENVLIDKKDMPLVSPYNWYARKTTNTSYAVRSSRVNGKRGTTWMHRVILGLKKGEMTDHINGDGLDNRRCNLRKCTNAQNQHNMHARWGRSKYRGVHWNGRWVARIRVNGEPIYLGRFAEETDAAHAYDKAAIEHHGEFANLNFPLPKRNTEDKP